MENYGSMDGTDSTALSTKKGSELSLNEKEDTAAFSDIDPVETPIEEALSNAGFTIQHVKIMMIMAIAILTDFMELEVGSLLGAQLLCDWQLRAIDEASLTACTYFGMAVGAVTWGKVSDIYG